jgi:cytochrome c oxidase subunit I+III
MPLFGAFYYWFPKITGRLLSERMGKVNFWMFVTGVNVAFFPMHILGLEGMPRRVYTYMAFTGWGRLNLLATCGAVVIALSVAVFLFNVFTSLRSGELAGANPWGSSGLEWSIPSPPPSFGFVHPPVVASLHPLWDEAATGDRMVATGLDPTVRTVLITSTFDAEPQSSHTHPTPSIWPLYLALCMGVTFIGSIFSPYMVLIGLGASMLGLVGWGLQGSRETRSERVEGAMARGVA